MLTLIFPEEESYIVFQDKFLSISRIIDPHEQTGSSGRTDEAGSLQEDQSLNGVENVEPKEIAAEVIVHREMEDESEDVDMSGDNRLVWIKVTYITCIQSMYTNTTHIKIYISEPQ